MFLGLEENETESHTTSTQAFIPRAQFLRHIDGVEVTLSPRHPSRSFRVSDEIEVHLARGILGRKRVVGFTIHGMSDIHQKNMRQKGVPLRGVVSIASILRVIHRMELRNKERMFGKYQGQIERAIRKQQITVSLF